MAALTELYYIPTQTLQLAEWHIYGSSRIGIYKADKPLAVVEDEVITSVSYQTRVKFRNNGKKQYELSNHLGNVLVTISDRRKAICNEVDSTLRYEAVVITASDYYSFGSPMTGRTWVASSTDKYRFGMNTQEKDDEIAGAGNHLAYDDRGRDPRLGGGWWSVDPLFAKYPSLSPYSFCNNNPIWFKEIDGRYFDYSNLTATQREQYDAHIKVLREGSVMFDYVYKQLEASKSAFVVKYAPTSGTNPAEFRPNADGHGGDIVYSPDVSMNQSYSLEENFHAYQLDNEEKFYPGVSSSNIEFEAKTFNTMALTEGSFLMPVQGGTQEFTEFLQNTYDFNNPTSQQMQSSEFKTAYTQGLQSFVDYWKQAIPDPKTLPGYKATPSSDAPNAVMKVKRETEATNMVGPRLENGDYYAE